MSVLPKRKLIYPKWWLDQYKMFKPAIIPEKMTLDSMMNVLRRSFNFRANTNNIYSLFFFLKSNLDPMWRNGIVTDN